MKRKIICIFLISVLAPTALLAYFGLRAAVSEKTIVERNMKGKYEAMAGIVIGDVETALKGVPKEKYKEGKTIEPVLLKHTLLFPDEVMIFDRRGKAVDGVRYKKDFSDPAFSMEIPGLPYEISVYELYPQISASLKEKKESIALYMCLICFSAVLILAGGLFTLRALSKEWRRAGLRNEFVSNVSHEIRRPLTSIRMFSEMLLSGRVPSEEKKKDYYRIISNESEKLTLLADNILDFSRIERGRKRYNLEPGDVVKIVTETVERFRSYIADEPRHVALDVTGSFPPMNIDTNAVSQALINLLSNAVKYSMPGKKLKVILLRRDGEAVITVIDEGIGVARAEQKKIFRPFYRSSQKYVADKEGSGLGLALVKYAANAHNGRVEIKSEEGRGSEFSIVLQL